MNNVCLKTDILTDGRNDSLSFHFQFVLIYRDAIIGAAPRLGIEGVESEHCLIKEHQLHLIEPSQSNLAIHLDEQVSVMR